jgi:hypothetical protein
MSAGRMIARSLKTESFALNLESAVAAVAVG